MKRHDPPCRELGCTECCRGWGGEVEKGVGWNHDTDTCSLLRGNDCSGYGDRPQVCREFNCVDLLKAGDDRGNVPRIRAAAMACILLKNYHGNSV
jgi:hypothetical protein